jgi:hypothetical protein
MRKVEARDEQAAIFAAAQMPAVRLGSALLVDDARAGLAAYLAHGAIVEPTPSDREVYDAK